MTTALHLKGKLIEAAPAWSSALWPCLWPGRLMTAGIPLQELAHPVDGHRLGLPKPARHRGGLEQRVVDRLFGGLERRLEQRRHAVGGQQRARLRSSRAEARVADRPRSRTRSRSRRCRCCMTSPCAPGRTRPWRRAASGRARRAARRWRRRSCTNRRRDRPARVRALAGWQLRCR